MQGRFTLLHDGASFSLSGPARQVVGLLALAEGESLSREQIANKVWPDAPGNRPRFYLRRTLLELNASPLAPALAIRPDTIAFRPESIDCRLSSLLGRLGKLGERLQVDALDKELISQPFLEGLHAQWLPEARLELGHRLAQGLLSASHARMLRNQSEGAAELLELAISLEPYREQLWRALFRALATGGNQAEIQSRFRDMRRRLANDMDLAPSPETDAFVESLLKTPSSSTQSLAGKKPPLAGEPFVGRADAISDLESLQEKRFITILGVGGLGKTRLASYFAEHQKRGVFWFSTLSTAGASLVAMVAEAFGTKDQETSVLQRLRHYSALFVIDNAESTSAEERQFLAALIRECPGISVLATSRELLHVPSEYGYYLGPVEASKAEPGKPTDAFELLCAYLPQANVKLSEREIASAKAICDCLGGVPLALKLAALKTRSLPLDRVLSGLRHDVRLLEGGKAHPEKSIVEAYLWTSRRLSVGARTLFGQLSPVEFAWPDTLATCLGFGLNDLEELVLAGLVLLSEDDSYRSVNPLRQLARLDLAKDAQAEQESVQRLVKCFEGWNDGPLDALREPGLRFAAEVLLRSEFPQDQVRGGKLAESLAGIWESRSEFVNAAAWLDRFFPGGAGMGPELLLRRGQCAAEQYDLSGALSFYEKGLKLVQGGKEQMEMEFQFHAELASTLANQESWEKADREACLAIEIGEKMGNQVLKARAMQCRVYIAGEQKDFDTAHRLLKEVLATLLATGDTELLISAREVLAVTLLNENRLDEAEDVFKDCDSRRLRAGQDHQRHWLLNCLGDIVGRRGDYQAAIEYADEALSILSSHGHYQTCIYSLQNKAYAYSMLGEANRAIQLLEEVLAITETEGMDSTRLLNLIRIIEVYERKGDVHTARAYVAQAEATVARVNSGPLLPQFEEVQRRLE